MNKNAAYTLHATLPLPPSINRTYHSGISRAGKATMYMDAKARYWKETATMLLLAEGWRRLPEGKYELEMEYSIYCSARRDIESVSKILVDTVTAVIGVDDRNLLDLRIRKIISQKESYEVAVTVHAYPLT